MHYWSIFIVFLLNVDFAKLNYRVNIIDLDIIYYKDFKKKIYFFIPIYFLNLKGKT